MFTRDKPGAIHNSTHFPTRNGPSPSEKEAYISAYYSSDQGGGSGSVLGVGAGAMRTSWNSVKRKSDFAERAFPDADLISLSPYPMRKGLRRRYVEFFLQMQPLFAPVYLEWYSTINILTKALRTQPRRSQRVIGVSSPSKLNLVRWLVLPSP